MKTLTKAGFLISSIWIAVISIIIFTNKKGLSDLELNAWGDFLAGAVAPLALIWFVIGYFQQGKEIHIQGEQIKRQADLEAEKIELTKRQERPHFEYIDCSRGNANTPILIIRFKNTGGLARNITVYDFGNNKEIIPNHVSIEKGGISQINLEPGSYDNLPTLVSLSYQDKHDIPYSHHEVLGEDPIKNNFFFKSMKKTVPIEEQ